MQDILGDPSVVQKHHLNSKLFSPVSFEVVGYGCMTCIGNSGPLAQQVVEAITQVPTVCLIKRLDLSGS